MSGHDATVSTFVAGIERRFGWHRSLVRRPRPSVGALALRSVRHATIVGRPLSLRSAIGPSLPIGAGTGDRPVRPLGHPFLRLWLAGQGQDDASALADAVGAHAGRLPRVTARQQTPYAPGGGLARLRREVLPVRLVPDVAAVGTVVSDRERGRPRAAARPSPSRSAYRAPRVAPSRRGGSRGSARDGEAGAGSGASAEPASSSDPSTPTATTPAGASPQRHQAEQGAQRQQHRDGASPPEPGLEGRGAPGAPREGGDRPPRSAVGLLDAVTAGRTVTDREAVGAGGATSDGASHAMTFGESLAAGWEAAAVILDGLVRQETYAALARHGSERAGERGPLWQYTSRFPRSEFRRGRERGAPPGRPLRPVRRRTPWLRSIGFDEESQARSTGARVPSARRSMVESGGRRSDVRTSAGRAGSSGIGLSDGGLAARRHAIDAVRGRGQLRRVDASRGVRVDVPIGEPAAPTGDGSVVGDDEAVRRHGGVRRALGSWPTMASRGRRRWERGVATLASSGWVAQGLSVLGSMPRALSDGVVATRGLGWSGPSRPRGRELRPSQVAGRGVESDGRLFASASDAVMADVGSRRGSRPVRSNWQGPRERSQEPGEAVQPLPAVLEPLASALGVRGPVEVQSGPLTRRSLRALGTVAATVGQTIFLERPVDRSPGALGVIAHELVHVASGDTGRAPTVRRSAPR